MIEGPKKFFEYFFFLLTKILNFSNQIILSFKHKQILQNYVGLFFQFYFQFFFGFSNFSPKKNINRIKCKYPINSVIFLRRHHKYLLYFMINTYIFILFALTLWKILANIIKCCCWCCCCCMSFKQIEKSILTHLIA